MGLHLGGGGGGGGLHLGKEKLQLGRKSFFISNTAFIIFYFFSSVFIISGSFLSLTHSSFVRLLMFLLSDNYYLQV